jgi:hypothetical protein
LEANINEKN